MAASESFYDLGMGVARDLHRRCIYYTEHLYTWEGYSSHSVSYPEHVHTWEGYSSHSVSSCVCVSPVNS